MSAEGAERRGELRRTPYCPRWGAENCLFFVRGGRGETRRTAKNTLLSAVGGGELLFFVRGGRGETRRTAKNTLLSAVGGGELPFFCPRRARRDAEDCEEHLIVRGGGRRTAFFCPRRARRDAENCEEHFIVRGGARRTAFFLSAEGAERRGELRRTLYRPRRGAENCLFFVRGGRGETRRTAKNTLLSAVGRGGRRLELGQAVLMGYANGKVGWVIVAAGGVVLSCFGRSCADVKGS